MPTAMADHLKVNVKLRIDEELQQELERLALLGDRTVAAEMRRALRHWVIEAKFNDLASIAEKPA